jgi:DNA-binding NarL/FixJ family response regulator
LQILFATKNMARFSAFVAGLQRRQEIEFLPAVTGGAGLASLRGEKTDLVVVDEQLDDIRGIAFAKLLVKAYPLVNTAIVSTLTAEEFHEATEGLGVLMQLPTEPQEKEADALLAVLAKIGALLHSAEETKL